MSDSVFFRKVPVQHIPTDPLARLIRANLGDAVKDIAEKCDMSPRAINRILNYEHENVHINTADKVCTGLGTTLTDVYGE